MKQIERMAAIALALLCMGLMLGACIAPDTRQVRSFTAEMRPDPGAEPIAQATGTVDVNQGDLAEMMRLTGIGEKTGAAILEERAMHGPFYYPEDLLAVRGIGEKTLAGFQDMLHLTEGE